MPGELPHRGRRHRGWRLLGRCLAWGCAFRRVGRLRLFAGRENLLAIVIEHALGLGVVVGEAWDVNNFALPFIYDGAMRLLFNAPLGTKAWALNDHGDVVGTYAGTQSFLYQDGAVTLLEQLPEVKAAGWVQLIPTSINDRGWIVGMGRTSAPVPPGHMPWKAFLLRPR